MPRSKLCPATTHRGAKALPCSTHHPGSLKPGGVWLFSAVKDGFFTYCTWIRHAFKPDVFQAFNLKADRLGFTYPINMPLSWKPRESSKRPVIAVAAHAALRKSGRIARRGDHSASAIYVEVRGEVLQEPQDILSEGSLRQRILAPHLSRAHRLSLSL